MYTKFFLDSIICVLGMIIGMIAAVSFLFLKEKIKHWISTKKTKVKKTRPKEKKKKEPHKRKKNLKDKIYSKEESWSQFNCDMDGIDHADYVKQHRGKQDYSYHFMKKLKNKKGKGDSN